jgi:hypothetical protein
MANETTKDLEYWKNNGEEDYLHTPISVLRYISELEKANETHTDYSIDQLQDMLDAARRLHKENPQTTLPTIRVTSTGIKLLTIKENQE